MVHVIAAKDIFISEIITCTTEVLASLCSLNAVVKNVEELDHASGSLDITSCLDITGMLGFSGSKELMGSILSFGWMLPSQLSPVCSVAPGKRQNTTS